MNLTEFLSQYPHISKASAADNADILNFYHQTAMSASTSDITYLRGNDFFAFLSERSESSIVLLMKDDAGIIQGLGVLSFRPGYINGELQTVGYLGDLRVKLNRKLIREWRLMYAQLIKHSPTMKETHYCRYYQTVLIDENLESRNNLAQTKIPNLHYQRLMKYDMVNIIGRMKFHSYSSQIRFAEDKDLNLIKEFLKAVSIKDHFAHEWSQELDRRLRTWNNFAIHDFVLVFDQNKKLLAVTMLWNPIATKQVMINHIPAQIRFIHRLLSVIPFIELKQLPQAQRPLNILYLHQIQFAPQISMELKKKVALDLLHYSFKKDCHMLAYADFENERFTNSTLSLFTQKMPMALYSVHFKENESDISFPLTPNTPVTFNMSLV